VRASAIEALARQSGDTRGYDPEAPESERRSAAERWMR
jgi:hypothetical protein